MNLLISVWFWKEESPFRKLVLQTKGIKFNKERKVKLLGAVQGYY